jgi:hypothetical protein
MIKLIYMLIVVACLVSIEERIAAIEDAVLTAVTETHGGSDGMATD